MHELSSLARTLGSWVRIPLKGMDVFIACVYYVYVSVEALRRTDPPSKESYRLCIGWRSRKSDQGPTKGRREIIVINNNNNNENDVIHLPVLLFRNWCFKQNLKASSILIFWALHVSFDVGRWLKNKHFNMVISIRHFHFKTFRKFLKSLHQLCRQAAVVRSIYFACRLNTGSLVF
jgi:hypothetical protein